MTANSKAGLGHMVNPAIRRVFKTQEIADDANCVTYAGVVKKTVFFMIMTVLGILAMHGVALLAQLIDSPVVLEHLATKEGVFEISITMLEVGVLAVCAVITVVGAIVCMFARAAVPVLGTLYFIAEGYLLAFISSCFSTQYKWIASLALLLTVVIVFSLLILYGKKIIVVNSTFKTIASALFMSVIFASISCGIIYLLGMFIPAVSTFAGFIDGVINNPAMAIIGSILFIIIACMFLISDFDAIKQAVDNKFDKKYEWSLAYGVAYTVLYLYFKILQLLVRILGKKK